MTMSVRDLMRAMNRAKILESIRTAGMISRIDLAASTGLSRASITGLTSDLIGEGLIIEKQAGEYEGGRRPMLLAMNPDGVHVVGVNISIHEVSVVVVNLLAEVVASHALPLQPVQHSVEDIVDKITHAVQACMWEGNFAREQIAGVGIGVPGLVYADTGIIRFMPNYGWVNVNLRDAVQERLDHPCFIDNSSNTLATAELWFGEGKGIDNFLVVTVINGVGLGVVINGHIFRGAEGLGGEFGHLTLDPQGPLCRCGKRGCVESYAGMISILRDALIAAENGEWSPPDLQGLTFADVLAGVDEGVPALVEIFNRAGTALGTGVAHLITLFNPSRVILTGKGIWTGRHLTRPFMAALRSHLPPMLEDPAERILFQEWTDIDWARGAGTLVLQELYKSPVSRRREIR